MRSDLRVAALTALLAVPSVSVITMTGAGVDEDEVTIDGTVFELDTDDELATATNTQVDLSGGATAAQTAAALAAAITTAKFGTRGMYAEAVTVNSVEQVIITAPSPFTTSESLTNGTITAALGGRAESRNTQYAVTVVERAPIAAEITDGNIHFVFPGTVVAAKVEVKVTATGAVKATDAVHSISGKRLSIVNSGSTDIAATDTVQITALLSMAI